ncbi:MAG: YraN family protein [Gammaproteobacteria bacterium]|nr:YraN family protein [Gammaproteobacteria bacterium]
MALLRAPHLRLGKQAEQHAGRYLRRFGLRLVEQNYHIRGGEIDLIMQDDRELVFVEVRYRKSPSHGSAAESINRTKRRRLVKAAEHYLVTHSGDWVGCRFDVVAFDGGLEQTQMTWLQNAFGLDG